MADLFIAAGSNINPELHLPQGCRLVLEAMDLRRVSTHYRSSPLGERRQPDYINGVWHARSDMGPGEIKTLLHRIEAACGRVRDADPYASRTLDLDLIILGDTVCNEPDLILPDPEIRERGFIYAPLLELEPEIRLPGDKVRLADQVVADHDLYYSHLTEMIRNVLQ